MKAWLIKRSIAGFERRFDYDMSYVREMLETSPKAFARFRQIEGMATHRENVPVDGWYAAKLATTLAEDCGPCTQLVVRMAEADGVAATVLGAILAGDDPAMGANAALGFRFAEASLRHDARADGLRDEVIRRWGKRAVVSLALTIAASRVFPAVRYALGHGHACQRVEVGGAPAQLAARHAA
jgi:hypothetical protein